LSTLPSLQHGSREGVFIRVHSWLHAGSNLQDCQDNRFLK